MGDTMPWNGAEWIPYDLINSTNSTAFTDIAAYDNTVTGGVFGLMVIIAFFAAVFIGTSKNDPETSLPISLLVTTILSAMFAAMNIVADEVMYGCILLTVASVIILYVQRSG
jgi:hypothetical protein